MKKLFLLIVQIFFLVGCDAPEATSVPIVLPTIMPTGVFTPVSAMTDYADLVITLERTICFGSCPAYKLTISGDGTGVYQGNFSVQVEGVRNFEVTQEQLAKLVQTFEEANYFSFEEYYSVPATDLPTTTSSITFQGLSKTVSHYGWCEDYEKNPVPTDQPHTAAPQALCDLEDNIDQIVNVKQWTGN